MNELQPKSGDREGSKEINELEAKEQEAQSIAGLAGLLSEVARGEETAAGAADGGLHYLYEITTSLGSRDPELAALIMDALEREHRIAGTSQVIDIVDKLREQLDLPPLA